MTKSFKEWWNVFVILFKFFDCFYSTNFLLNLFRSWFWFAKVCEQWISLITKWFFVRIWPLLFSWLILKSKDFYTAIRLAFKISKSQIFLDTRVKYIKVESRVSNFSFILKHLNFAPFFKRYTTFHKLHIKRDFNRPRKQSFFAMITLCLENSFWNVSSCPY